MVKNQQFKIRPDQAIYCGACQWGWEAGLCYEAFKVGGVVGCVKNKAFPAEEKEFQDVAVVYWVEGHLAINSNLPFVVKAFCSIGSILTILKWFSNIFCNPVCLFRRLLWVKNGEIRNATLVLKEKSKKFLRNLSLLMGCLRSLHPLISSMSHLQCSLIVPRLKASSWTPGNL